MKLEFACKEAQRRTEVLKTSHYVVESSAVFQEYLVVTQKNLPGYSIVAMYEVHYA